MSDTLGTNTTGYSYPGATYWRKGVQTVNDEALWAETADKLILAPFVGKEGSGLPFITKNQAKTNKTDTIRLEMGGKIKGSTGVWGNYALEGAEANIPQYYADVYTNQLRQAWKDDGEMSRSRSNRDLKAWGIKKLAQFQAEEVERYIICALEGRYDPHIMGDIAAGGYNIGSTQLVPNANWFCADGANNNPTYSGTASTFETAIKASEVLLTNNEVDFFSPNVLIGAAVKAKNLFFEPVTYKGFTGLVGFIHPNQTAQLHKNNDWFLANIHAIPADQNGPIFTGHLASMAVGMWEGIMLFESTLIHSGNNSYYYDLLVAESRGTNHCEIDSDCASVYRAIFCGQNALAIAESVSLHLEYKDDFDYNDKTGVACSSIFGVQRPDFLEDNSTAAVINQSSMIVSTYSPAAQT